MGDLKRCSINCTIPQYTVCISFLFPPGVGGYFLIILKSPTPTVMRLPFILKALVNSILILRISRFPSLETTQEIIQDTTILSQVSKSEKRPSTLQFLIIHYLLLVSKNQQTSMETIKKEMIMVPVPEEIVFSKAELKKMIHVVIDPRNLE